MVSPAFDVDNRNGSEGRGLGLSEKESGPGRLSVSWTLSIETEEAGRRQASD